MTSILGVLLDIDGTLVDSNNAHARAWIDAMAEQGIRIPYGVVRNLIGMGGDKLLPEVSGISEETQKGKAISKRRKEIFLSRYLPSLYPTPGAQDLLRELKKRGLKMAVATSATADELDPLLRICGADQLIQSKATSDQADHSKPDPDILEAALADVGLRANQAVMLGDTPYDVESARRAGVPIIALRCGGWSDKALEGAVAIYDDPSHLLHELEQSPLGKPSAA